MHIYSYVCIPPELKRTTLSLISFSTDEQKSIKLPKGYEQEVMYAPPTKYDSSRVEWISQCTKFTFAEHKFGSQVCHHADSQIIDNTLLFVK